MRVLWEDYRREPVKYADLSKEEEVFVLFADGSEVQIDENIRRKVYLLEMLADLGRNHAVEGADPYAILREYKNPC